MDHIRGEASYWQHSRKVRETFARSALADVLNWAFGGVEVVEGPDDVIESFRYGLAGMLRSIEPAWAPVAETLRSLPLDTLRAELRAAFATIRPMAHAIATDQPTALYWMPVTLFAPSRMSDRDGRPRWMLRGRVADAVIWAALRLFSEVPRSLIRSCAIQGCERIYVAGRNQRYCVPHQREGYRLTQRAAERAFRQRAKTKNTRAKRRTR